MSTSTVTVETETGTVRYTVDHDTESYGVHIVRGTDPEAFTDAEAAVEIVVGTPPCEHCDQQTLAVMGLIDQDPEDEILDDSDRDTYRPAHVTAPTEHEIHLARQHSLSAEDAREITNRAVGTVHTPQFSDTEQYVAKVYGLSPAEVREAAARFDSVALEAHRERISTTQAVHQALRDSQANMPPEHPMHFQ